MSDRLCPSCGQQNSDTVVYCVQCGVLLRNAPIAAVGQPLPTSVAVASRRVEKVRSSKPEGRSLGSRIFSILVYCASVALGVAAVLALMNSQMAQIEQLEKNSSLQETRRVMNPAGAIQQQILSSRYTPSSLSQQLINDLLKSSASIDWTAPSFIPSSVWPKWERSHVELGQGAIVASVKASVFGYPIYFSETFVLAGSSRQWSLKPRSGTIGLLPLPKPFLSVLTPFVAACSLPLTREIKSLEAADSLQIRAGFIDFTTR